MPPKIYNIKEPLDLDRLYLAKPTNKNGSHFIKMLDVDNPIYFLGPKCFTKNGFIKSGKKTFCDFVFSNEDSDFLTWLDNLEEKSRGIIYSNRETWFETPLDEHDIENSMSLPYKPYKSGKYFIVRANVPTTLDKINIKIYDENENETDPDNVKENTKVLSVFEFQGIRCSVRSFQFEIELKQLLIVEPEKLFEKCIIGLGSAAERTKKNDYTSPTKLEDNPFDDSTDDVHAIEPVSESTKESENDLDMDLDHVTEKSNSSINEIVDVQTANTVILSNSETHIDEGESSPIEIIDVDFPLEDITDSQSKKEPPLRLKSRNDVYYKLYKEMRQRAKAAKREALANYLEAKRIKNTYLLEDISESESDEEDDYLEESNK
jgi:hypothetical protein